MRPFTSAEGVEKEHLSCDQKQPPFGPRGLLLRAVCGPCCLLAVGVDHQGDQKAPCVLLGGYLDGLGLSLYGLFVLPLVGKEKQEKISRQRTEVVAT